jgi:hypothetical protein
MEKQSFNKETLSSLGITVSTTNPIYIDKSRKSPNDYYLNFDQSNSNEVKAFQNWLNKNYAGWANGYPNGVVLPTDSGYGSYGSLTATAFKNYGSQYLASLNQANTQPNISTQPAIQPTETAKKEAAKKGLVWDSINNKFAKAKESGLLDTVLGIFGVAKPQQETINQPNENIGGEKSKMSMGVKIAIGVGALAIVGGIIYAVTKKSK